MAEKKVIELEIETNLGSLKSQLKQAQIEVQTLADKFGATSVQAVEAAKKAAILKDKIGDAKTLTDAFNPDAKFKALTGTLTGVAGGFSVVTGALGAFGKQNQDVEKALLKVQSAMALASGAQAIGESVDSFKQLGAVIKATSIFQAAYNFIQTGSITANTESAVAKVVDAEATVAQGVATVATTTATTGASVALKVLRTALISTGVGALVVGLGMLIANLDKIMNFFTGAADKSKKYGDATKKSTVELHKQVTANERVSEALKTKNGHEVAMAKASGASTEAIRKLNLKHADEEISLEKASLATARNTLEKEKNTLANLINAGATDEIIQKQRELVTESRKNVQEEIKDLKDAYLNKKEVANANQVERRQEQTDARKDAIDANKEANQKDIDLLNEQNAVISKADADAKRNAIQTKNETQQLLENISEQNYQNTLNDQQKEELAVNDKYFNLETLATGNKDALAEIEIAKMNELNDLNLKYQDLDYKKKQEAALKLKEAAKKTSEEEIKDAKVLAEQKTAIQMQGLDTALQGISLIKGLFEKQKGVQKASVIAESAIGIAKMIISNKIANAGALASPANIALPGSAAPIIAMNNISTGIGIAANIAATAKALKALGGGTAPSTTLGGSGGGATSVMSPSFNVVGNSGLNQLGQLQQKPMKAYVVSSDMTTAQSLDRNRIENATLVQ